MKHSVLKFLLSALTVCLLHIASSAQTVKEPPATNDEWTRDYKPFRVAGNLYYVGTYDLACYLITTPKGHILINTGIASSAAIIKQHIEALGFNMQDVRILLTNQAHYDHVGAIAEIKKMTGAALMVDEKDAPVMADGGKTDYYFGGSDPSFQPATADRLLKDRDTITLGGTNLVLLHHPGHTKGSCSYLVDVRDSARSYRVLIANMPSIIIETKFSAVTRYPGMVKDYAYTLDAMPKLDFDIWVAAHASQFDLHEKRKETDGYDPSVFADKKNFKRRIAKLKAAYKKKLAEE